MFSNIFQHQRGFNLIELLMVCAVSGFLLLMLGNTLITQYKTARWQQAISELQENGRFASFLLKEGIKEAGYSGCGRIENLLQLTNQSSVPFDENNIIRGYEAVGNQWQPALSSRLPRTILKGSDVIEINQAEDSGRFLAADMVDARKLSIESPDQIKPNDRLMVSTCQYADIIEVESVVSQGHNQYKVIPKASLSRLYSKNAFVGKMVQVFFYIADTKRKNEQGKAIYALYTLDKNNYNTELVEGISAMKIRYGWRQRAPSADSILRYATASVIDNQKKWPSVIAVKIDLLVNSIESLPDYRSHYQFSDKNSSEKNDSFHKSWPVAINLQERSSLCSKVLC
ncbi:MAG: hypothetical protein K0R12_207 [Gammaproteobacteria bacterium]|jgi:type IV pilus assembly protein PilW|nr:hypothetical protein [Gammaproteobacteria bacterium]